MAPAGSVRAHRSPAASARRSRASSSGSSPATACRCRAGLRHDGQCNAIGTTPGSLDPGGQGRGRDRGSEHRPSASAPTSIVEQHRDEQRRRRACWSIRGASVSIRENRLDSNGGVGIDLVANGGAPGGDGSTPNGAAGGPGRQRSPAMPDLSAASSTSGVTSVTGSLSVPPAMSAGQFVVEFFSQSRLRRHAFGPAWLRRGGSARSAPSRWRPPPQPGPATFAFTANGLGTTNVGGVITATATDGFGSGNTSELSACVPVVARQAAAPRISRLEAASPPIRCRGRRHDHLQAYGPQRRPRPRHRRHLRERPPDRRQPGLDDLERGLVRRRRVQTVTCNLGQVDPGTR